MGHLHAGAGNEHYERLRRRLDMHPIGMPQFEGVYEILKTLFNLEQAEFVSCLPIKFFAVEEAVRRSGKSQATVLRLIDELCSLGVLFDFEKKGKRFYVVAPSLIGFIEFAFMRRRREIDQKSLAALIDLHLHHKRDILDRITGSVCLGRALVHEERIAVEDAPAEVLDYEKAGRIIAEAKTISVGMCYCRHVAQHNNRWCGRELDVCMGLGSGAKSLIDHGLARRAEPAEALDILARVKEAGMVQVADNVMRKVTYICNCCGCCCGQLTAVREAKMAHPVATSGFIAAVDETRCRGCGRCAARCPVGCLSLVGKGNAALKPRLTARLDESYCLGCGVCVAGCRDNAIRMERRPQKLLFPQDAMDRVLLQAVDTGKLQNLLFNNPTQWYGRLAMEAVGGLLRLGPARRLLAVRQVRSSVLAGLIRSSGYYSAVQTLLGIKG